MGSDGGLVRRKGEGAVLEGEPGLEEDGEDGRCGDVREPLLAVRGDLEPEVAKGARDVERVCVDLRGDELAADEVGLVVV